MMMSLSEIIKSRVSQKSYNENKVDLKMLEELLDISVFAPNHKMREPWNFVIIEGDQKEVFKKRYLERLPKDQQEDTNKKLGKIFAAPVIVAFIMPISLDYDDEIEDIQANSMLVQNFLLLANEKGLSTHVKTPLFIKTDLFKDVLDIEENELVTCLVMVGYADQPNAPKRRTPAKELIRYYK
jgi:nitroreductase